MAEKAEKRFASTSFDHPFFHSSENRDHFETNLIGKNHEVCATFLWKFPLSKGIRVQSLELEFLFGIFIFIILDNNDELLCTFHFER